MTFRHCEQCGCRFLQRENEEIQNFHKRRFCGRECRQEHTAGLVYMPTEDEIYKPGGLAEQQRNQRRHGTPEDRDPPPYTIQQCDSTIARVVRKRIGAA
jgi:hypothetical protein